MITVGAAIGSVIGQKKPRYLMWGKTPLIANELESQVGHTHANIEAVCGVHVQAHSRCAVLRVHIHSHCCLLTVAGGTSADTAKATAAAATFQPAGVVKEASAD
jgi:Adenylate and Guanylate cyclase catalytic domain